jgi:PAS domain S-box-containing protein
MPNTLRKVSVVAGFTLLVLLLIANALITTRKLSVQVTDQERVNHTGEVLSALKETELLLVGAETGQRGYLLTGESKYLTPYNNAVAQIDDQIQTLSRLTSDNPVEQTNVADLGIFAHQKLDELNETILLARAGNIDQAKAIVLSDRGLFIMRDFRHVAGAMQAEENQLEAIRIEAYRRSVRVTNISIVAAAVVGGLGLVILAYFILKERALRDRYLSEIHAREEWFRVTLTSIGDAVIATDRDGRVTFFNTVAESLTGVKASAAVGIDISSVFPIFNEFNGQPAENPVKKVITLGNVVGLANHTVLKHADGRSIPIEDSAAPIRDDFEQLIGVVLVFRDVSAERKSQELLRRTDKLAAAARLSATVAHEINNPLEAVVNLLFLAKTDPGTPPAVVEQLTLAEQEIDRVAHITRQTLGFYRESNAPELIDVNALIESALKMYSNKLDSSGIRVECHFGKCPPIQGVAGELRQVFSNMVANAMDAVVTNGTIAIRTTFVSSAQNGFVEVVIADSGPGVAPEHLDRIFEPFFTTKKDVGTGLGLWVTKEIIERHGGGIHLRPNNGHVGSPGAVFTLQLPSAPAPAASGNSPWAVEG